MRICILLLFKVSLAHLETPVNKDLLDRMDFKVYPDHLDREDQLAPLEVCLQLMPNTVIKEHPGPCIYKLLVLGLLTTSVK